MNLDTNTKVVNQNTVTNNKTNNTDITNTDNQTTNTILGPHVLRNKYVQNGLFNEAGGIQNFSILLLIWEILQTVISKS